MEELQKDKFRYERKYIIQNVELPSFIFEIQNKGFLEVFNERKNQKTTPPDIGVNKQRKE